MKRLCIMLLPALAAVLLYPQETLSFKSVSGEEASAVYGATTSGCVGVGDPVSICNDLFCTGGFYPKSNGNATKGQGNSANNRLACGCAGTSTIEIASGICEK